ncbi:MAG: MarR family transcriptional regulator [Anaerovoracaceae bacterium]
MSTRTTIFNDLSLLHRGSTKYIRSGHDESSAVFDISHPVLLLTIARHPGFSQDEISQRLGYNKGAVARMTRSLIDEGYVTRRPDPADKRRYQLMLSEKGEAIIPVLNQKKEEYEQILTSGMTEEQVTTFRRLIAMALDNLRSALKENAKAGEKSGDSEKSRDSTEP